VNIFLEIVNGPSAGKRIPVAQGAPVQFGRGNRANIAFPSDTQMSGVHFAAEWDGQTLRILDLRSTNGTTVNGQRIGEAVVRDGDRITAGETSFLVRFSAAPVQPAPSAPESPKTQEKPDAVPLAPAAKPGILRDAAPTAASGAAAFSGGPTATRWPPLPGAGAPLYLAEELRRMAASRVPAAPSIPSMPTASLPGMPTVPSFSTPSVPTLGAPQIPSLPSLPGMPGFGVSQPSIGLPAAPSIPAMAMPVLPRPDDAIRAAIAAAAAMIKPLFWQPSLEVGGWKFTTIPKTWGVPEDRSTIQYALKDIFPSTVTVGEEPLPPDAALQKVFDSQIRMLVDGLPEAHLHELRIPAIPGAQATLGADIVYKLENGQPVVLRRVYAESNRVAGVVMLMTIADVTAAISRDWEAIEMGLRFEATPPAPPAGESNPVA